MTTEQEKYPRLSAIGNLIAVSFSTPEQLRRDRHERTYHLVDWREGRPSLCGYDPQKGWGSSGGRGIRSVVQATCPRCLAAARLMMRQDDEYYAETKALRSEIADHQYQLKTAEYLRDTSGGWA